MRDFWLRSPIYIVICVLLGFTIAFLAAQNITLKDQIEQQRETQATAEDIKAAADRIGNYLRCVSLTPVEERTPELIEACFSQDLPPQANPNPKPQSSTGGSQSFLAPAPQAGTNPQPGNSSPNNPSQPVDNSPNPGTVNPQQPNTGGLLTPVIDPVCGNLTPRLCGTLGL